MLLEQGDIRFHDLAEFLVAVIRSLTQGSVFISYRYQSWCDPDELSIAIHLGDGRRYRVQTRSAQDCREGVIVDRGLGLDFTRLEFFAQGITIGGGHPTNSRDVVLHVSRKRAQLLEKTFGRALAGGSGQSMAPFLELWDAGVAGVGETRRLPVTFDLPL